MKCLHVGRFIAISFSIGIGEENNDHPKPINQFYGQDIVRYKPDSQRGIKYKNIKHSMISAFQYWSKMGIKLPNYFL